MLYNDYITKDKHGVEFVHPEMPRFYLHQFKRNGRDGERCAPCCANKWTVIDRTVDFAVIRKYSKKIYAIKAFFREYGDKKVDFKYFM